MQLLVSCIISELAELQGAATPPEPKAGKGRVKIRSESTSTLGKKVERMLYDVVWWSYTPEQQQ